MTTENKTQSGIKFRTLNSFSIVRDFTVWHVTESAAVDFVRQEMNRELKSIIGNYTYAIGYTVTGRKQSVEAPELTIFNIRAEVSL